MSGWLRMCSLSKLKDNGDNELDTYIKMIVLTWWMYLIHTGQNEEYINATFVATRPILAI